MCAISFHLYYMWQMKNILTNLKEKLCNPVEALLKEGNDDTWPRIRSIVSLETGKIISEFELCGFEMNEQAKDIKSDLINYAKDLVKKKARQEVKIVSTLMKERFTSLFNYDINSKPRVWAADDDVDAIAKTAESSCRNLFVVLATIRLDEDLEILITPTEGESLMKRFVNEIEYPIIQAKKSKRAKKCKKVIKDVAIGLSGGVVAGAAIGTAGVAGVAAAATLAAGSSVVTALPAIGTALTAGGSAIALLDGLSSIVDS